MSINDEPQWRYNSKLANIIESKWQKYWQDNKTFQTPTPKDKKTDQNLNPYFIMDMFPYPSGAGLHVGHPLGYVATDVVGRFKRMTGNLVLHSLGYDAFGLPAEQYAIQTGKHPRQTTLENISNMEDQLKKMGLAHDPARSFSTIDDKYVKWTQWIFLQIYNSYFDEKAPNKEGGLGRARPISDLVAEFYSGKRALPEIDGIDKNKKWGELDIGQKEKILSEFRLAYRKKSPVNWAPGLGTVLANEEITAEGKSERGNFPVFTKELSQWSMRITAYAQRLLEGLKIIDWPDKIKQMQTNWIGQSRGAYINFKVFENENLNKDSDKSLNKDSSKNPNLKKSIQAISQLKVFTTRPDTLHGATFCVIAPEHPLAKIALDNSNQSQTQTIKKYIEYAQKKSAVARQQDAGKKTGVFTNLYAQNPVNGEMLPIFIADYVLMSYGTGSIMAVPADDQRDEEFAKTYKIPIKYKYFKPPIEKAIADIEKINAGKPITIYRLQDWLFSRQRYWGEPFPIVYDENDVAYALPDVALPITLPEIDNYSPQTYKDNDENSAPFAPLSRAKDWLNIELDLGDGLKKYRRETNTMPNWAGSCWYYLRYADPNPKNKIIDPKIDSFWLGPNHNKTVGQSGGVDLYIGGVEHAVLHLLYARFWHKILFDLGHVSSPEPFHKLFNQGYIQAYAYTDKRGAYVDANQVEEKDGKFYYKGEIVQQEYGKMGKSLKNVVTPDEMYKEYGADTFRVYEMSMGPLDISRPWEIRAVVGAQRFLQRLWRNIINEETGELITTNTKMDENTAKLLHKTLHQVRIEMDNLRPNTAIAKLIEYNNHLTSLEKCPKEAVEPIVIMSAPFAPHIAEELWQKLGHETTITYQAFPEADKKYLQVDKTVCVVQINGKVKAKLEVNPEISKDELSQLVLENDKVKQLIGQQKIVKTIPVPPKIFSIVLS
ncbi:MAG: leucine--tRNA ligase [Bifidobacteriaceae bacterium]|jgi:leucyl-tRNA synthetase|nr:leucine--tRNA ligase [Bifidobacteriaceae bacterium]